MTIGKKMDTNSNLKLNSMTDNDMIIILHNLASKLEEIGKYGKDLRQVADRFAELSKEASVSKQWKQ